MANSVPPRKNPGDPWRAEGAPSSPPTRRRRRLGGWGGMILAAVAVFLITDLVLSLVAGSRPTTISYSEFGRQLAANNISKIYSKGDAIEGQLREAAPAPKGSGDKTYTQFKTQRPVFAKDDLWGALTKNKVTVTAQPVVQQRGILYNIALSLAPVLLLVLLWLFVARRMSRLTGGGGLGGLGGFGRRTPVPIRPDEGRRTTFEDVAGIDEVEAELNEVVDFLKRPDAYRALGARMPRGVLLAGPPGTGKTLLARAVAGEADVPFFSASASEFIEMIVGVGAGRVRELFAEARKVAPAIIFIDEIDTIGRARGAAGGLGGHDEREQTLNQILTEMDGFSGSEGVVVIAATNRPDVLDPALTRPGRFDRTVHVSPPDRTGREAILRIHLRDVPLQADIDLTRVARATPGMTGAELANLANEAALLAVKRGRKTVGQSELSDALEKVQLGAARPLVLSPEERRRTAYHESGHALLGMLQPGADPVRKITIVPRGRALGVTLSTPDSDRYAYSEEYLRGRIIGALGGMAAEHVVFGVITTGAENDLEQVTNLVRGMVGRWGMSDRVGPLSAIPADAQQPYGLSAAPSTLDVVDAEMRRIVDECYGTACRLLDQHREQLDSLAERLLEAETLEEGEAYAAAGIPRLEKPSGSLG